MREILLTSSVLIFVLLALRRIFWERISRRVQYALWGLVLVRLLAPVSLPALHFSILTMAEPVQASISAQLEIPGFTAPVIPVSNLPQEAQSAHPKAEEPTIPGMEPSQPPVQAERSEVPGAAKELSLTDMLRMLWLVGAAAMVLWLLASNLAFSVRLRQNRTGVQIPGCRRRVYLVESGLASPCLFGVLRPAIYLTPSAVRDEASLRHVLAHEETHARHMDPLWALLRGLCLALYWFNPLVWIAALASKTDCEMACDEGAIRCLGEEERLAYGKTLLSLIPVRRRPGNPLLSATTMSSDKKRLRDRISRIARRRRTGRLALCAVAVLTAGACLVTFAGGLEEQTAEPQDGPISAAELRYFNEQFFNGEYMNIHNQFLSSVYETPADIDLFELAYCGIPNEYGRDSGKPQADEATVLERVYGGSWPDCPTYEINTATLDAFLTDTMGLTLAETNQAGMDNFTYLPEYDTYYWCHGDTNYRTEVAISVGAREGDLLHLYYEDTFFRFNDWMCVTLRETESGRYQFVSNAASEKPAIPTAFPAGEPLAVIPLTGLTPCEPEKMETVRHSGDCAERLPGPGKSWDVWGHHIQGYRSTDGNLYLAEITAAVAGRDGMTVWEADCFAEMPNDEFYMELYQDLFGWDGFILHYIDYEKFEAYKSYYAFDEDGALYLICQVTGYGMDARIIDLDGDGNNELLCTDSAYDAQLFFQRDDKMLYHADIAALTAEALSEEAPDWFNGIDSYARCLRMRTSLWVPQEDGPGFEATPTRNIYFVGEKLLVYKPEQAAVDHLLSGVIGPEAVVAAARQDIQRLLDAQNNDYQVNAQVDDWRITTLKGPWYAYFYEGDETLTVEIYRYDCEFHAAAPEKIVLAGEMYLDEDGWYGPGNSDNDYLYFRLESDGSRTYLFTAGIGNPGDAMFHENLEEALHDNGILGSTPAKEVQNVPDYHVL